MKRINLAAMVPHSMVRLYVMGPDAAFERSATDAERAEIKRLLVHPDEPGIDATRHMGWMGGRHQHVSAAHIHLVFETYRHRHRWKRARKLAIIRDD